MPERIRILFIGELNSSHLHNWLDMLAPRKNDFLYSGIHLSPAPVGREGLPFLDAASTESLPGSEAYPVYGQPKLEDWASFIPAWSVLSHVGLQNTARYIAEFKPHIIHTLGLFPGSIYYLHYLRTIRPTFRPMWLIQARGGPDIALNRHDPKLAALITEMLQTCDCFLADNVQNYQFAREMGLAEDKISPSGPVPGTGGIDVHRLEQPLAPSQKENLILWPKAYFFIQSDGLPVIYALKKALQKLPDARLIATAAITPEVSFWFHRLLEPFADRVEIRDRVPYAEMVDLYKRARVLLAPSLSDGIPNSMYEAMASRTVPILSPIETIATLFTNKKHVLYADNLAQEEITRALVQALTDDDLADRIAETNFAWIPSLAGKNAMREKMLPVYRQLAQGAPDRFVVELDRLARQCTAQKEENAALQEQHTALQEQHTALQEQHTALQEQHTALQEQCRALQAESSGLQERVALAETQLAEALRVVNHPLVRGQRKVWQAVKFWK